MEWEFRIGRCKLVYTEWMNSKVLPYSTENYIQYPGINHNGKEYEKECIYMNHFAVQQKLTQHCKSTILQFTNDGGPSLPAGESISTRI